MLATMSWDQFCGWLAYYQLEPWGEDRNDVRSGIIASIIANVNRDPRKRSKPFKPIDFMTGPRPAPRPMTEEGWKRFKASLTIGMKRLG